MSASVSRRGLLALGCLATIGAGATPLRASPQHTRGVGPVWRLAAQESPTAQGWLQAGCGTAGGRPFMIGEGDLYAWWRQAVQTARVRQQPLQVHGLTRWGEFSFLQICAREVGLRVHSEARHDLRSMDLNPSVTALIEVMGRPWPIHIKEPPTLLVSWTLG